MYYVSTRGQAPRLDFTDALLTGLASDGGLYVPESWPQIGADEIAGFAGQPYAAVAERVLHAFAPEIDRETLRRTCEEVYAGFTHPATAPLVQIDTDHFVLELFRGPTLAFKDFAMRMLARLMDD
ncbi:MAG: threonine synthase, partial [Pseudomonadota bacterium]